MKTNRLSIAGAVLSAHLAWPVTSNAQGSWTGPTPAGAPVARYSHTAVWTGSTMIVWGGYGGASATVLGDGARYDPASGTWSPMNATGAATARYKHTAVWTGAKMIIWGGTSSGGNQTQHRIYDAATDTWTAISNTNAPLNRYGHTAVWTGSKMIVWGGYSANMRNDGGLYDPAANAWTTMSTVNAPTARDNHTAVWTGSKMIVWGGSAGVEFATGASYDPLTDSWTPLSTLGAPTGRRNHTAVWTGTRMIVWGGVRGTGTGFPSADGAAYDPTTDTWAPLPTAGAPSARFFHTALWTGSAMVVWGGYDSASALGTGGVYDPVKGSWNSVTTTGAPTSRYRHSSVWTGSQMVVWGGYSSGNSRGDGASWDPHQPRMLYYGIDGASDLRAVRDDPNRSIGSVADDEILLYAENHNPDCAGDVCDPTILDDLRAVAATEAGGLCALALHATTGSSRVVLADPGNSEALKTDLSANYRAGDGVYVAGFSAGGGDAQNLLEKLHLLGIPVVLSGHIDSVEIGFDNDASIPPNTRTARGFYQTQSIVRGERNLVAVDPVETTVTNTRIADPLGPSRQRGARHHRNMDNDERTWGALLADMQSLDLPPVPEPDANCVDDLPANLAALVHGLAADASPSCKRAIREKLARTASLRRRFEQLVSTYRTTTDPELRLHLADALSHADVRAYVPRVVAIARAQDTQLFVSLAYSLRLAGTLEAKKALLALVPDDSADAGASERIAAVHLALGPLVHAEDLPWLTSWARRESLASGHTQLLLRTARRFPGPEAVALLRTLEQRTHDPGVLTMLRAENERIQRRLERGRP
jgi:N-acetylneuraminic acid mutarotase